MADVTFKIKEVDVPAVVDAVCSVYNCPNDMPQNTFTKKHLILVLEEYINRTLAEKHRRDVEDQLGVVTTISIT
jgi:hypothetical protein